MPDLKTFDYSQLTPELWAKYNLRPVRYTFHAHNWDEQAQRLKLVGCCALTILQIDDTAGQRDSGTFTYFLDQGYTEDYLDGFIWGFDGRPGPHEDASHDAHLGYQHGRQAARQVFADERI